MNNKSWSWESEKDDRGEHKWFAKKTDMKNQEPCQKNRDNSLRYISVHGITTLQCMCTDCKSVAV